MPHSLAAALLLTTMAQAQLQESLQKALTAHKANLLPEALEHYLAVLSLNPQLPAIHNNVAAIHLAQNSPADAEASFRAAVELKPDYAEAVSYTHLTLPTTPYV